jgi:hypothetical protein
MLPKIPQDLERFLNGLKKEESPGHWGFTVYNTYLSVSTSASEASTEEVFDKKICERFQAYIESDLRFTVEEPYGVKIPLDIDYIRLPSANISEARTHFRAKYGLPKKHEVGIIPSHEHYDMPHIIFVVIDEETVKMLLDAPEAIQEIPAGSKYWSATRKVDDIAVKVVDVDYGEDCEGIQFAAAGRWTPKDSPHSITFYGYMKTTLR